MATMEKFTLMLICLGCLLPTNHGLRLSSNISTITRKLCPGTAVFACNAFKFHQDTISYFINNTNIVSYTYVGSDTFPRNISQVSIHGVSQISVQLLSSEVHADNSSFNFQGFIISVNFNDLNQLVGSVISCGSFLQRSNSIEIGSQPLTDTYPDTNINVSYMAYYTGENRELSNISLQLTNETMNCNFSITYIVELESNNTNNFSRPIQHVINCNINICSVNISINQNVLETYSKDITYVVSVYEVYSILSGRTLASRFRFSASANSLFQSISTTNECSPFIECPSFSVDNCTVRYGYDSSYNKIEKSITLEPNNSYNWPLDVLERGTIFAEVTAFQNMTAWILRYNVSAVSSKENNDIPYLIIGYLTFGIAAILLFLGYLQFIYLTSCQDWNLITAFHLFNSGIWILSLILWITYHIAYIQDICGKSLHRTEFAVSAMAFSLIATVLSIMSTGGFCILFNKSKFKHPKKIKSSAVELTAVSAKENTFTGQNKDNSENGIMMVTELQFGRQLKPQTVTGFCITCNCSLEEGVILCQSCNKYMCVYCGKRRKAYIPRNKKIGAVCKSCNELYWQENERLSEVQCLTANKCKESSTEICHVCNKEDENLTICPNCFNKFCNKHSKDLSAFSDISTTPGMHSSEVKKGCILCYELLLRKNMYKEKEAERKTISDST